MKFLKTKDYVEDLKKELSSHPKSVRIVCFRILADKMMLELKPFFLDALRSGTNLEIYADSLFSKHKLTGNLFTPFNSWREDEKKMRARNLLLFNELRSFGATVFFGKEPSKINLYLLPFTGRDHRKIVTIERASKEVIAYFGAANLEDGEQNDFMVKVIEKEIVGAIYEASSYQDINIPKNDLIYETATNTIIFQDAGRPFKSTIYEEALKLISNAERTITFVSQIPPEPSLLGYLVKAAKRGIKIEIVLPDKSHQLISSFPYNVAFGYAALRAKSNNINIHHCRHGFTHAKILLVDNVALVGSHNLSFTGVAAGTVELSAEISDLNFVRQVEDFINELK
jgi:phosphatidylserine/phosphatidylglycerophosphate/cardiolipin synthase-like enzyme